MPTLLVKNIEYLATFDDARREIRDGALLVRDNVIDQVGTTAQLGSLAADRVLDLAGYIVMPGMVNTHHHMYQNLTRVMVQDDELFVWLTTLYPIWAELDDDAIYVSARVAMAELMQSGCTTSSDHLYVLPNNATLDAEIRAAREVGIRFHAARGAMSRGQSQGGLPPDNCVEKEDAILRDAERLIGAYHDPAPHSMSRIILAPCSPFSVTPGLMKEAAQLARAHQGVHLHALSRRRGGLSSRGQPLLGRDGAANNRGIAGAAANIPYQCCTDCGLVGIGLSAEQSCQRNREAGCTISALECNLRDQCLIHNAPLGQGDESFRRDDVGAFDLPSHQEAGVDGVSIQQHKAGSAPADATSRFGRNQRELCSQQVDEPRVGARAHCLLGAVEAEANRYGCGRNKLVHNGGRCLASKKIFR